MTGMKKQLLILTSTFPRWEADTDPPFVFELCKRLKNNYEVTVLCPHAPRTKTDELVQGIQVKRFRYFFKKLQVLAYEGGILTKFRQSRWYYCLVPFFVLGEILAAARLMRNRPGAIINAHWMLPQGLAAVIAGYICRSRAPLVCTLHGGDIFGLNSSFATALKRFVLSKSSAVITVSRAMAEKVISLGVRSDKVHVIPMGVDLKSSFVPSPERRNKKSLLFVGRFVEKKGLAYLVEALPAVLQKHPEARLSIVGHGPGEAEIRQRLSALQISDRITFIGAVENAKLPGIYQSAEIVIFPSIIDAQGDTEGFGLVMVEALGCACAVIASDLPAIHDIILDNKTGLLVGQKNAAQLAEKIIYALDNPHIPARLGKQGRAYVLERYDWEITAEKYCRIFENLKVT